MDPLSAVIAVGIGTLFMLPAVRWRSLGRWLVALMFLGGATFNSLVTLPNTPGSAERLGLLAAAVWSIGMLPLIPPDGMLIGIALTGAPGVSALILMARHRVSVMAPTAISARG
jgi:hypothetical protein